MFEVAENFPRIDLRNMFSDSLSTMCPKQDQEKFICATQHTESTNTINILKTTTPKDSIKINTIRLTIQFLIAATDDRIQWNFISNY